MENYGKQKGFTLKLNIKRLCTKYKKLKQNDFAANQNRNVLQVYYKSKQKPLQQITFLINTKKALHQWQFEVQ